MTHDQNSAGPKRRTVVTSVGIAGVGAVSLAACGSGDSTATSTSTAAPSGTSSSTATGSSTGTATGSATAAAPAGDSIAASQVPVGGGYIDTNLKVVVTQPTAGEFKAFSSICTHQGCPVDKIENGVIECPCHDSHFNLSTGAPEAGPATAPLAAKTVTVNGDNLVIS